MINRRQLRGYPLDDNCKKLAAIVNDVDGAGDPRKFCTGIDDGEGVCETCANCKACAVNATPWNGERFGVLPGQITVDEILQQQEEGGGGNGSATV